MKIGGLSPIRVNPYGVASWGTAERTIGDPVEYPDFRAYQHYIDKHPEELGNPPPTDSAPTLADQIAAIIAANGATGSPLGNAPQTVIIQPKGSSNMTVIVIVLVGLGIVYWYVKKHPQI